MILKQKTAILGICALLCVVQNATAGNKSTTGNLEIDHLIKLISENYAKMLNEIFHMNDYRTWYVNNPPVAGEAPREEPATPAQIQEAERKKSALFTQITHLIQRLSPADKELLKQQLTLRVHSIPADEMELFFAR